MRLSADAAVAVAPALAALHAEAFADGPERPWSADEFAALARSPGAVFLSAPGEALAMARITLDEAELLTLCVSPAARRAGLGRTLLRAAERAVAEAGARRMILEVAASNVAARTLYEQAGYSEVGARRGYHNGVDALVLARELFAPPG